MVTWFSWEPVLGVSELPTMLTPYHQPDCLVEPVRVIGWLALPFASSVPRTCSRRNC